MIHRFRAKLPAYDTSLTSFFLPPSSPGPIGGERVSSEDQKPGPGGFWDVPVRG